jgi:hypothetical protein
METPSGECGLYAEDQSGKHCLWFASSDPNEIGNYASEMSELFNVPVKVDVQSYKSKDSTSESGGKKKMAKSGKVNKTKLCQELLLQGVPDKEAIDQLTAAHLAEEKAKVSSAPVVKKEVRKAPVEEPATDVEEPTPIVEEGTPVEKAAQEAEAESTEIEE